MRAWLLSALGAIVLCVAGSSLSVPARAQAVDAKSVKKAVEEYVKPATSVERRKNIEGTLLGAAPADLAAALKTVLKRDADRPLGIELALKFQVRGVFNGVEKALDTDADRIAALGLISNDKGAAAAIVKKWAATPTDSELYGKLKAALLRYGVEQDVLEEIRKAATGKDATDTLKADALAILKYQSGFEAVDVTELATKWSDYIKPLANEFKRQPFTNIDLSACDGWVGAKFGRRGINYRVEAGGVVELQAVPVGFDRGTFKVSIWVYADDKEPLCEVGVRVATNDGKFQWAGASINKNKWEVPVQGGNKELPYKAQAWHQFTIKIRTSPGEKKSFPDLYVDGQTLAEGLSIDAMPAGLHFKCESGNLIIGSVDYTRN